MEKDNVNKRLDSHFVAITVCFILLAVMCIFQFQVSNVVHKLSSESTMEKGSIEMVEQNGDSEIQDKLNAKTTKSMFNVFMNTDIVFEDGKSKGNLLIQNVDTNYAPVFVEIYTKDTNELVYKSYEIPVGFKIEEDKLNTNLDKGVYDCVAYFNILNESGKDVQNKIGINVKITVNN